MKKRLVLGSALVLLAALMAWGTWAYFTTDAHVTNVITTGTIQITLNDTMTGAKPTEDGGLLLTGVMPGVAVEKKVSVTNDNAATAGDAWVRVKVDTTVTSAPNDDGQTHTLGSTFAHGQETLDAVEIGFDTTGADARWIPQTVTEQDENGQDRPVTYYYYKTPLTRGEKTSDLFSTVTLNRFLPNEYQGCTVNIAVSAQAVQVKNNNNNGALTALTAATLDQVSGWPAD